MILEMARSAHLRPSLVSRLGKRLLQRTSTELGLGRYILAHTQFARDELCLSALSPAKLSGSAPVWPGHSGET